MLCEYVPRPRKHAFVISFPDACFADDTPVGQMSGRVGSSLLSALGLPELSFHSVKELEDVAVSLVQSPGRLASLRKRQEDKQVYPFMDSCYGRDILTRDNDVRNNNNNTLLTISCKVFDVHSADVAAGVRTSRCNWHNLWGEGAEIYGGLQYIMISGDRHTTYSPNDGLHLTKLEPHSKHCLCGRFFFADPCCHAPTVSGCYRRR